jgi:hypothetical protein
VKKSLKIEAFIEWDFIAFEFGKKCWI